MDKLKMCSLDGVAKNIELIGQLFPNAITEVKRGEKLEKAIDFDILRQELSDSIVEGREERYQFTWPDKKKAILAANAPINAALRPIVADSVAKDGTPGGFDSENLYIEGDNLEVLKLLRETYLGKVKMIYIDPPYNTGNDFVYEDDFSAKAADYLENSGQFDEYGQRMVTNLNTNGRFHTDWLNMIYPRLKVARDLLADDGVIFISIDDNEQENLKKICDEIFGESNFVAQITAVSNPSGRDYGGIARMHDYILAYRKSFLTTLNLIKDEEHKFKMFDSVGGFELRELRNRNIKFNKENRPNLYYPFYINTENHDENGLCNISLDKADGWLELYPLESQGINTVWRWGKEKSLNNLNVNVMAKPMSNGRYMIVEKYRESKRMARSVWWDKSTSTQNGSILIKELMGGKVFDYPKNTEMLLRLCEIATSDGADSLVLDFFSGSATTAHAVMQLNAEDGGRRKYVMVQLPELTSENSEAYKAGYKNICEIGKERIRRAGRKIKEEAGLMAQDLDFGFRCLRLDSSNMKDVYYKPEDLGQMELDELIDNVKDDRSAEDLLFQVMLELSLELSLPIETVDIAGHKVFKVDDGYLIACFEPNITEEVVTAIAKETPIYAVLRDSSLLNDSLATNFEQIFKAYSPATKTKVL